MREHVQGHTPRDSHVNPTARRDAAAGILGLQRQVGNQAVARLVAARGDRFQPRPQVSGRVLQRVMGDIVSIGGLPYRTVVPGGGVSRGDNFYNRTEGLYTFGMSGCATIAVRKGTHLRMAHCTITVNDPVQIGWVADWLTPDADQVVVVFGTENASWSMHYGKRPPGSSIEAIFNAGQYPFDQAERRWGVDNLAITPQGVWHASERGLQTQRYIPPPPPPAPAPPPHGDVDEVYDVYASEDDFYDPSKDF